MQLGDNTNITNLLINVLQFISFTTMKSCLIYSICYMYLEIRNLLTHIFFSQSTRSRAIDNIVLIETLPIVCNKPSH